MNIRNILLTVVLGVALLSSGCSKATAENYAKVQTGMSRDEVHALLGNPDETSGSSFAGLSMSTETWNGAKEKISVTYTADKLALKSIEPKNESAK